MRCWDPKLNRNANLNEMGGGGTQNIQKFSDGCH